jgi:hypothetical protein
MTSRICQIALFLKIPDKLIHSILGEVEMVSDFQLAWRVVTF